MVRLIVRHMITPTLNLKDLVKQFANIHACLSCGAVASYRLNMNNSSRITELPLACHHGNRAVDVVQTLVEAVE